MQLDDAYSNAAYIPGGNDFPARWDKDAAAFRATARAELDLPYGPDPRQRLDLFLPEAPAKGLFVFVHGGYWLAFDKSTWSHFAAGALARGYAVAMPSYPLCPQVRIGDITRSVQAAIALAAQRVDGPIRLAGHSAGGHLVARMACDDLAPDWRGRGARVVPISALSDLSPLRMTTMNKDLQIDAAEAFAESPISHAATVPVSVWVGGDERPAFIDQSRWLSNHWRAPLTIDPGLHHFNVIDRLADPDSALMAEVFR